MGINQTQFKASGTPEKTHSVIVSSPYNAALAFFLANPSARKCSIIEGVQDEGFFTVKYDRLYWPRSFKYVTKVLAKELPKE
jgi:hypothetical protein